MHFVYFDEHENEKDGQLYTSVTAAIYSSANLIPFRRDLVGGMADILFGTSRDPRIVHHLPVLHACNLPRDVDDEKRLALFKLVVDLSLNYEVKFVRVGYFNNSIAPLARSREERIEFCLSNCLWPIQSFLNEDVVYVYELSYAAHQKFRSYNDSQLQEMFWQSKSFQDAISVENFSRITGKFYCDKHNHHMYAADFVGYALCQKEKSSQTEFQKYIASSVNKISRLINPLSPSLSSKWDGCLIA